MAEWKDPATPAELMRRVIEVTDAYKAAHDGGAKPDPRHALATIMVCIGDIAVTYLNLADRVSRLEADRQAGGRRSE